MEFDPVGSAQFIPDMIRNDTLIEELDQDQLSECLKHIILNVDDSLYILNQVQSKYEVSDRFKAVHNITTDFGEGDNFDSQKFVGFIKSLGRCLRLDILDSIASIIESKLTILDQLSILIKQNSQKTVSKSIIQIQKQPINKNIEELKKIPKTDDNFDKISEICERIATENDRDAMSFAIREKFVYVTEKGEDKYFNIFTQAAWDNKQDLVRLLIESGIDINSRDKMESTALLLASSRGHLEIVKLLLAVPGINVNAKNNENMTALHWASWNSRLEVVKLLLAFPGIDVNAKGYQNNTALMYASEYGHHEVVKLLLTVPGIDINAKNDDNKTVLNIASYWGNDEVVKLLKDHGAV